MLRRSVWQWLLVAAMLALTTPALAGGWAVVTLDSLPSDMQAGKALSLGFMVRQHGVTPIDTNPFGTEALQPLLMARNTTTGETLEATARKEGPVGHFVVDVTFPSAGSWEIEIIPPPFEGTKLGTFVVAAASKSANTAQQGSEAVAPQSSAVSTGILSDRSLRVWGISALVIIAALALTAFVQRESLTRRLGSRYAGYARSPDETAGTHSRV
ncbi:MAG TPA: hypothetical protein VFZ66_05185 [Herpetosiphonaceae bacterium]